MLPIQYTQFCHQAFYMRPCIVYYMWKIAESLWRNMCDGITFGNNFFVIFLWCSVSTVYMNMCWIPQFLSMHVKTGYCLKHFSSKRHLLTVLLNLTFTSGPRNCNIVINRADPSPPIRYYIIYGRPLKGLIAILISTFFNIILISKLLVIFKHN